MRKLPIAQNLETSAADIYGCRAQWDATEKASPQSADDRKQRSLGRATLEDPRQVPRQFNGLRVSHAAPVTQMPYPDELIHN